MSDSSRAPMPDLELALADLASAVTWPTTPDLAPAVLTRIATPGARGGRPSFWGDRRRRWRWSLVFAALLALLVAGLALGMRLGLDLLSIGFGPAPTIVASPTTSVGPSPTSSGGAIASPAGPLGIGLGLGRAVDLDEARAVADFDVLIPADLGSPDALFDGGELRRGQIGMLYHPRPDLPASDLLGGAGLLITENRGLVSDALAEKVVGSGGTVERVDVGGDRGYWLAGAPHWFWYLAADGTTIEETRRAVGNTLAWQHGDLLLRIEGAIDRDQALAIAASMH